MHLHTFAAYRQVVARALRELGHEVLACIAEDLGTEDTCAAALRAGYDDVEIEGGEVDWLYQEGAMATFIAEAVHPWNHGPGCAPRLPPGATPGALAAELVERLEMYAKETK